MQRLLAEKPKHTLWLVMAAVALGALTRVPAAFALVFMSLLGVLLLLGLVQLVGPPREEEDARRQVMWWTMTSFVAHLVVGLIITNTTLFIYLGSDAWSYHIGASELLRHWHGTDPLPSYLFPGKSGFYYLLAGLYWVFGAQTSAGLAFNATLAAALVPIMTDVTRRLFGQSAARYIPPMVVVLPGLFVWTSQLLKEAPIIFFMAVALNCAVRLSTRFSPISMILFALSLASLFGFRAWVALMVAAGLMAAIPVASRYVTQGLSSAVSTVSMVAVVLALGLGYSGYRVASQADLENAQIVRRGLSVGVNSGFAADADVSTARGALSYLPLGLLRFTLGPFPWQIAGARQAPAVLDACAWWLLLPSLWRGLRESRRLALGRRASLMVLPAAALAIMLCLSVGNFGTVVRERAQVVVLLLPLFALGLSVRRAGRLSDTDTELVEPPGTPFASRGAATIPAG